MKKNKISKNWLIKQNKDFYFRKSRIEGYRSRAVYKLQEINNKFKFLKKNSTIIDLGAAPGSWSQFISKEYNAKILAIDIKEIDRIENVFIIKGDFTNNTNKQKIINYFGSKVDIILSDMAVNTTGNKNLDSTLTGELCLESLNFALQVLKIDGYFISKVFMGSTFKEILDFAKKNFKETNIFKPSSSKKNSKEIFLICKFLK